MKPLTPLLFVATALSASAFSVDFIGLENDIDLSEGNFSFDNTDGNQLVRGAFDEEGSSPGNVLFGAPTGTTAEVSLTSEGAAIELDANDVILVSFIVGGAVENVQLSKRLPLQDLLSIFLRQTQKFQSLRFLFLAL